MIRDPPGRDPAPGGKEQLAPGSGVEPMYHLSKNRPGPGTKDRRVGWEPDLCSRVATPRGRLWLTSRPPGGTDWFLALGDRLFFGDGSLDKSEGEPLPHHLRGGQ